MNFNVIFQPLLSRVCLVAWLPPASHQEHWTQTTPDATQHYYLASLKRTASVKQSSTTAPAQVKFSKNIFHNTTRITHTCCCLGLTVFGEGAGDVRGGPVDDKAFGPIRIDIPIIYFNTRRHILYVRCMYNFILGPENVNSL